MRINSNQDVMQNRAQVQTGGGQQESAKPVSAQPAAQPRDAQAYAGKQNQALAKAESNQGSNQGNSMLGRLAQLGGNQIPVMPIAEPFMTQKNDEGNTRDRFVHIEGDIDTQAERKDLQGALDNADGAMVIVQTNKGRTQFFEATRFESNGDSAGYIPKVRSLTPESDETFTLHNLNDDAEPLEGLRPSQLYQLKQLTNYQHEELQAVGSQGPALLAALRQPDTLKVQPQYLSQSQIKVLSTLSDEQFEKMRHTLPPTQAFMGLGLSTKDSEMLGALTIERIQAIQQLSPQGFHALQGLKEMSDEGMNVLKWKPEQLNVLSQLNGKQFDQLQSLAPQEMQKLKTVTKRQEEFAH